MGTPADVVKARMMNQPTDQYGKGLLYKNSLDCLTQTIKHEGLFGLYKGFVPCWLRMAPWSLTFWLSFEQIRRFFGAKSWGTWTYEKKLQVRCFLRLTWLYCRKRTNSAVKLCFIKKLNWRKITIFLPIDFVETCLTQNYVKTKTKGTNNAENNSHYSAVEWANF